MRYDLAIVGAGPAGLAVAIEAARRGLRVVVLEQSALPVDKACGEGVMPAGVRCLERMGVTRHLHATEWAPFDGIRYLDAHGIQAEGRLRNPGMGIRRTALSTAMLWRARELGAEVRERTRVVRLVHGQAEVRVETTGDGIRAFLVVAADGLHSRIRTAEGLCRPTASKKRFGLRQHFLVRPWTSMVEVYLGEHEEAYVTPVGPRMVGVALLFEPGGERASFNCLDRRLPTLAQRLEGATPVGRTMGAGPLKQRATGCVQDRLVLVGDAAGYVDAITGEGVSLALRSAELLGPLLPEALSQGATRESLRAYARAHARLYRRYALVTGGLLRLERRPWLRRAMVSALATRRGWMDRLVQVVGEG